MKRVWVGLVLASWVWIGCGHPSAAIAGEAEGPRILFLDDIFHPFHAASRNPYEDRIETERHDFTQSARTVGHGVFQVEGGYSYFYKDEAGEVEQAHTGPELMMRLGLTDDIEFRVRWNYVWEFMDHGQRRDSAEDLRWSIKLNVTEQDGCVPESALEIRNTIPTGGAAFSTERVDVALDYIYQWWLGENVNVFGSTEWGTDGLGDFGLLPEEPADEHFAFWQQSAGVGLELTERISAYLEWFGIFSKNLEDNGAIHVFNIGVDYYVTRNLVLDLRLGKGLSNDADDFFTGVGGGYRF